MSSYEIQEYDISEWSCGVKGDYVSWLNEEEGWGYGLLYVYTGNGNAKYYNKRFHTNDMLFTLNN